MDWLPGLVPTPRRESCAPAPQYRQQCLATQASVSTPIQGLLANNYLLCLTATSRQLRTLAIVRRRGDAHAAKFVVVIFLVKDVPLLAAFQDFLFLRSDSLAHFQLDLLFVFQRSRQNLHHLLANCVAVVDEFHFLAVDEYLGDLVREPYNFFAGKAHLSFPCSTFASWDPGSSHPTHFPVHTFEFPFPISYFQ